MGLDQIPLEVWHIIFRFVAEKKAVARTCRYFAYVIATDAQLLHQTHNPARAELFYDFSKDGDAGPKQVPCVTNYRPSAEESRHVVAIPRFDLTTGDFTLFLRYNVNDFSHGHEGCRVPLLHDWVYPWSFGVFATTSGPNMELRRNINSHGSDPEQGLIYTQGKVDLPNGGLNQWVVCAFTWSPSQRTMQCFVNGQLLDTQTVRPSVQDVVVQRNTHSHFYLGWKNDGQEQMHGVISHCALYHELFSGDAVMRGSQELMQVEGTQPGPSWIDIACLMRPPRSIEDEEVARPKLHVKRE